jgi:ubiquinone/menaquinone biosynthesis C-methylase UbiE
MKKSGNSNNRAGTRYNKTRQADPHILSRLFQFLSPEKDKLYLDIGCGTGNYTIGLSERGINFGGVDPSIPMIQVAKKKSKKINLLPGS